MIFYLGTHQPQWLADERFAGVPLFVSRRTLAHRRRLPDAVTDFALDSGGFTELQLHGRWTLTAAEYAAEVRRLASHYGPRLRWVAPQDWMCERLVIDGGVAHGVTFAGTKLSVEEHQRRTVANFVELRALLGDLVIPVLQGYGVTDYWRCEEMYADVGVDLAQERLVGVGTVCRRQATSGAERIIRTIGWEGGAAGCGRLRLHGFGVKTEGLATFGDALASADSTAWSDGARQPYRAALSRARRAGLPLADYMQTDAGRDLDPTRWVLPGHDQPGDGRRTGHVNCANCAEYALGWRGRVLEAVAEAPRSAQRDLFLDGARAA